jgi:hypothetical protein
MAKKIAVLVRDRQEEALRMSVGLILLDDQVEVYLLDRKLEETKESLLHYETLKEMEMKVYSNSRENEGMEYVPTEEIAQRLLQYDHVLPY